MFPSPPSHFYCILTLLLHPLLPRFFFVCPAGGIGLPVAGLAGPYALFFVPKGSGGGAGGQAAKDALGNDVKTNAWLATHQKGDRSLTQGLKVRGIFLAVLAG
jgi:cytochrome b6-f complex iron-sulfur subunit